MAGCDLIDSWVDTAAQNDENPESDKDRKWGAWPSHKPGDYHISYNTDSSPTSDYSKHKICFPYCELEPFAHQLNIPPTWCEPAGCPPANIGY